MFYDLERERERESNSEWQSSREKKCFSICGDLLWISISVRNDYWVDLVMVSV